MLGHLLSRRTFAGAGALAAVGFARRVRAADSSRYAGLQSDRYLGPVEIVATVDAKKVFTEGPAADGQGRVFFTNTVASQILVWDPATKRLSVFRENTNEANGLYFDPRGRLLCCEGKAGRVTRLDPRTGQYDVLADKFNGFPFAAPNDLCLDDRGRIYFTSRPGVTDPTKGNPNAVYRIDPDGKVTQLLRWPQIHMPNGIVTSPDNRILYVVESHPEADHHRDIRAFDLGLDGSVSNERVLIDFAPGRSGDGMCIDAEGNLHVAAGLHKLRGTSETLDTRPGIHVISPQGKLLAFRETPVDTITNCTFGGPDLRTLYVTCGPHLLAIRSSIPGKASYKVAVAAGHCGPLGTGREALGPSPVSDALAAAGWTTVADVQRHRGPRR